MKLSVAHFRTPFLSRSETFIYGYLMNFGPSVRPVVFTKERTNERDFPFPDVINYSIHRFTPRWVADNGAKRLFGIDRHSLKKALLREKIDLMHGHFGHEAYEILSVANDLGLPLVTTFYGYDISKLPRLEIWRKNYAELFARGDVFLVEGTRMRRLLVALGCPREKVQVQHIGVDLDRIPYRVRRPQPQKRIVFLFCGRLVEKKGVIHALSAFELAHRQGLADFEFRIIGDGPLREDLEKAADQKGLRNHVAFLGMKNHTEFYQELATADVFISPSVTAADGDTEGGAPTVILEAQAAGLPVISTLHADIPEVVVKGKSALLAPESDPAALAEHILYFFKHPEVWAPFGLEGRRHIEKSYDIKTEVHKLESIYLENGGARAERVDGGVAMSRGSRLVRASVVRVSNMVLSIVVSFFMMPFLVRNLGDKSYGLWALVGSFLGYYGLIDLGLSSAVGRFLSQAVGRRDAEGFRRVTSTSFYLFLALGAATALVTAVLALLLPIFIKDAANLNLARFLVLLLGFNFAMDFPVRSFNAVFTSNLREDIGIGISVGKTFLNTAFIVIAIKSGYGLVGLAAASVSASLLDSAVRVTVAYSMEPNLSVRWRHFDRDKVKPLFDYSIFSFIAKIAEIFRFKLDQVVITAYVSLAAVTHYVIAMRLVEYLSSLMTQALAGVGPLFSQDEGRNDFIAIRKNLLFLLKISLYLSLFAGGMALIYGRPFIERWMGPAYRDSYTYLVVFLVPFLLLLVQAPSGPLLYGISQHKFLAVSNAAEGLVNLVLSLYWVRHYGVLGVAMGTAVPMAVMAVVARPWYVCHAIGMPRWSYYKQLITHGVTAAALLAAGCALTRHWAQPDYRQLILCGLIQAALYWPVVLLFGFRLDERRVVAQAARMAVSRASLSWRAAEEAA